LWVSQQKKFKIIVVGKLKIFKIGDVCGVKFISMKINGRKVVMRNNFFTKFTIYINFFIWILTMFMMCWWKKKIKDKITKKNKNKNKSIKMKK